MRIGSPSHGWRLVAWLGATVATTLVHDPLWLGGALLVALLCSGAGRGRLLRRALLVIAPLYALLAGGYVVMAWFTAAGIDWHYPLLLGARLALLSLLTAWMLRDVDLRRALARWPRAQRWLVIVHGQQQLFRRLARERLEARRSRTIVAPRLRHRYLAVAATALAALDKAVHNAEQVSDAMRSRGGLDD